MAGHEHHHRWHYYAILVDDLLLPSWLDHKTTSKIVRISYGIKYNLLFSTYVHHIITIYDCYGAAIVAADRYVYSCLGVTLLAILTLHPIQPKQVDI